MATQLENSPAATTNTASRVDQFVGQQLKKTTQQVRVSDIVTGLIATAVYIIAFFLISAIVDAWIWSFNPTARLILLAALMGGLALISWYFILPFFFRRINPQYAAKMIEEAKPEFKNSLLNYLSLKRQKKPTHRAILNEVSRKAATDISSIAPDAAVDKSSLITTGFLLVALVAVAVAYFIFSPKNPWPTVMRILSPGSKISKPAAVLITDVEPGDASVFFGDKIEVTARVYGATEDDQVTIVYSTKDEQIVDAAVPMASDGAGIYSATLTTGPSGIQQSLSYRIEAGDGSSPRYTISVRPNPTINVEQIKITPPKYTGLNERTVEGNGEIQAVEGSKVEITARANLPIEFAYIVPMVATKNGKGYSEKRSIQMSSEKTIATGRIIAALNSNRDRPQFTHYKINFRSVDQHKNENPNVYPIRVIADLAPELEVVEPSQLEVTIPVNQPLPIKVWAADLDYEISSIDIQVDHRGSKIFEENLFKSVDQQQPGERVNGSIQIVPQDLNLAPGDRAIFYVTASDNRISSRTEFLDPNVTRSENYTIIVTDAIQDESKQKPRDKQQTDPENQDQENQSEESNDQGNENSGQTNDNDTESESNKNGGQDSESQDSESQDSNDDPNATDSDSDEGNNQNQGSDPSQSDQEQNDSQSPSDSSSSDSNESGSEQKNGQNNEATDQASPEKPAHEESKQDQEDESSGNDASAATKQSSDQGNDGTQSEQESGSEGGLQDSQDNEASDGSHNSPSGKKSDSDNQQTGRQSNNQGGTDPGKSNQEGVRDEDLRDGEVESLRKNPSLSEQFEELKEYFDENKDSSPNNNQSQNNQDEESQNSDNSRTEPGEQNSSQNPGSKSQPPEDQPKNPGDSQSNSNPNTAGDDPSNQENQPDKSNSSSESQNQPNDNSQSPTQPNDSSNSQSDTQEQPPGASENKKEQQPSGGDSSPQEQQNSSSSSDQEPESGGSSSQSDMPSSKSGSQAGDSDNASQQGDPQSQGSGQSGSEGENKEGGSQANESSSSTPSSESDSENAKGSTNGEQKSSGQPTGSSSSDNASSSSDSGGNENSGNKTGIGGSDSVDKSDSTEVGAPNPDKANLEYTKKLTDLILDQLEDQKYEPDPELLERMNWNEQDLDNFLKQWEAMKKKAQSGDERSKRDYEDALRSLGFSAKTKSRKVIARKDQKFSVNEDGAVDQIPAKYADKFNDFLKRRNRTKRIRN